MVEVMDIYCGLKRETVVQLEVTDLGCGAGRIRCLECEGSGVWAFMEPEIPACPCVECKGTGHQLVSV